MGYGVIPVIASIVLAIHHVAITDASRRSKVVIGTLVTASLVIWQFYPRWAVLATVVQVGASMYMLVYLKVREDARR